MTNQEAAQMLRHHADYVEFTDPEESEASRMGASALDTLGQYREALRRCHALLQEAGALVDPETHPDLEARITAELLPCDGECPTLPTPPEETR